MNQIVAAWKLSLYQIWNRKRRWVTLLLYLFPVLIIAVALGVRDEGTPDFYQNFVTVTLGAVLIPFVAIYWGSGVLSDEIEGKTLVYLWTRPADRGILLFWKLAGSWPWLALLCLAGVLAGYFYGYRTPDTGGLGANLLIIVWDVRALLLAGITWSCVAFLLSVCTKRPLTYGLLLAYLWELIPQYGPGFVRRLSVTQQMLALATHKQEQSGLASKLIDQVQISELEAVFSLLGIAGLCAVTAILLLNQREFLSDDPARSQ